MSVASVDQAFRQLLNRIELTPFRITLASERYSALKATIEGTLPGKTMRQIGSFKRGTKIRPVDFSDHLDFEVLVSFGQFSRYSEPGTGGVSLSEALQIVQLAIGSSEFYRVMPPQQGNPKVRVEYADQLAIELVPAFEDLSPQHYRGPMGPNCYVAGGSLYRWITADYEYDSQTILGLNARTEGQLAPTIKLVKAYFRNAGVPLRSFHTEILVANLVPSLVSDWNCKGYGYGYQHLFAGFLTEVSQIMTSAAVLRGSYSPPVDSGLSYATLSSLGTFLGARAKVAWQLCNANTVRGWTEFFGVPFPSGASKGAY
jgi:SMODS domain-containing protein